MAQPSATSADTQQASAPVTSNTTTVLTRVAGAYGFTPGHSSAWTARPSGLPGQTFRNTGTNVVEERDGPVAIFDTFIDGGTPPVSSPE